MPGLPIALVSFAVGILALQWQPELPPLRPWVFAAAALSLMTCAVHGRGFMRAPIPAWLSVLRALGVAAAAATLGFAMACWRAELRLADALPSEWEDRDIEVVGVIGDLPHASTRGTRFALDVERVLTPQAHVPTRISLAWYSSLRGSAAGDVPAVRAGERWRITVRLKRPHGNVNPHGFDLEAWLLESELRATGYVRQQDHHERTSAFAGRPVDWVQRAREQVRERILAALPDAPYAGVIVALAIGDQRAIPESQWLVFNRTGITHLISISGLHVTVFAALAAAFVHRAARRSARLTAMVPAHRVAALMGAVAAFAYVLLAGAQIPAQRTLVMLIVAAVGLWLARPGTARMVWLWALAIVLAFDPWAGLTPGFWLSFGAVALLLYSGTCRLHSTSTSVPNALARSFRTALRAQAVVTVGLVPMTLAVFQQVSIIAPVANALAIPVVTFVVVPVALAAIVLPLDLPWQLAHMVFAWLMVPLEALARLPGVTWQQHAPQVWTIAAAMLGVVWMLAPPGVPLRVLGAFWLLPLVLVRPIGPAPGSMRVTVLDVGQGLATVVQTASHTLLYDTGPGFTEEIDAGGRIIAPFLRAAGIGRLSMLMISHLDSDHSGGTRSISHTVPIDARVSSVTYDDPLWRGGSAPVERCRAGQAWTWDGVSFTVLHPPPAWYAAPRVKTNDMSCVLRVASRHGSILLTGDVEAKSELAMLREDRPLRSDVLVVPHHGSRTSSTARFIAAVAPAIAIFTPGYRNRFGHPRADVLDRYRLAGARLLRTDLHGAITLDFGGEGLRIDAERDRRRRYWYDPPRAPADE